MTSITDPNMSDRFTSTLEEIHNKQLKTYGEIIDSTTELCQAHKHFVKSALGIPASSHLDLRSFMSIIIRVDHHFLPLVQIHV